MKRHELTDDDSTHEFRWQPGSVWFSSFRTHAAAPPRGSLIHEWAYTAPDVPAPGSERLHINLWLLQGSGPINGQETELVIQNVSFTPRAAEIPVLDTLGLSAIACAILPAGVVMTCRGVAASEPITAASPPGPSPPPR